jgi:succinylglutamic semialdehyde dehydrogenase
MGMDKREGGEEIMRGRELEKEYPGHYVSPSIHLFEKFDPKAIFLQSEIFGPNCTFIPYQTLEQAIEIANMGQYGLASAVFTEDKKVFDHCFGELEAGIINLNRSTVGASSLLPFGGIKNSGNYRPAGVSMIDACCYPVSALEVDSGQPSSLKDIPGLNL